MQLTREQLRAVIEDARARAHAAVLDAYWRFTRCRGGRPPARELYIRRNELDERLRKLRRSAKCTPLS